MPSPPEIRRPWWRFSWVGDRRACREARHDQFSRPNLIKLWLDVLPGHHREAARRSSSYKRREVNDRTASRAASLGNVPLTLSRSKPRWAGAETAANRMRSEGRNSMARMPLAGTRHSIWMNPSGVTPICGSGSCCSPHEEKCHRSQRFYFYGRLVRIIIGQAVEIDQAICDRVQSEQSEHGEDFFRHTRGFNLAPLSFLERSSAKEWRCPPVPLTSGI